MDVEIRGGAEDIRHNWALMLRECTDWELLWLLVASDEKTLLDVKKKRELDKLAKEELQKKVSQGTSA